jgi:hypothetical protein
MQWSVHSYFMVSILVDSRIECEKIDKLPDML